MAHILVTGAGGFLGSHLCPLLARTHKVTGVDLHGVPPLPGVAWRSVPDTNEGIAAAVAELVPDVVVHAAFLNKIPDGLSAPVYLDTLCRQNIALFEACGGVRCGLLLVSSSAVYGPGEPGAPIGEQTPFRPVSLYGCAKGTQELLAGCYATSRHFPLAIVRLFNLCGPGQKEGMLIPDWVSRVSRIADGAEPLLKVFTLATSRDLVDVRDAAAALAMVASDLRDGLVMNVASGKAVPLREIAEELRKLCPKSYTIEETRPAAAESDVALQCGSYQLINKTYGWSPSIPWERSLCDVWAAYRDANS